MKRYNTNIRCIIYYILMANLITEIQRSVYDRESRNLFVKELWFYCMGGK